jgi:hypothetical protein
VVHFFYDTIRKAEKSRRPSEIILVWLIVRQSRTINQTRMISAPLKAKKVACGRHRIIFVVLLAQGDSKYPFIRRPFSDRAAAHAQHLYAIGFALPFGSAGQ